MIAQCPAMIAQCPANFQNDSPMPSKLFLLSAISHENQSYSQISCELLQPQNEEIESDMKKHEKAEIGKMMIPPKMVNRRKPKGAELTEIG